MDETPTDEVEVADVCKCFMFETHPFWKQVQNPKCPQCGQALRPNEYLASVIMKDKSWFIVHADCYENLMDTAEEPAT